MPLDIRPFTEETSDVPAADSDNRANTFMDDLRARIAAGDEKQRQKWEKARKPAVQRKPITPARPEWLNQPKSPQAASKPTAAPRSRPFGSPKRKRPESNASGAS